MAGGFLSKGLIGVAVPAGTALLFLVVRRDLGAIRKLYLGRGIFLFLLPIALWIGGAWWLEGPELIKEVVRQSLWRFLSSSAEHSEPFYFYFIPVLLNTLPWTPLPLVWLSYRRKNPRPEKSSSPDLLALFALVWFLTVFVGLSIASAKRTLYIAPLYPPSALLMASAWTHLCEKFPKIKHFEIYGVTILFFVYVAAHFAVLLPSEKNDSFRPVFEAVRNQQGHGPIYLCGGSESLQGATVFYLGKIIPVCSRTVLMQEKFEAPSGTILVIPFSAGDEQFLANLRTKGFRLLAEKTVRKVLLRVYSNSPLL
jgi:4-amino-4-deoxy-L-arabinose transferase-like glycosyltransferase